MWRALSEVRVGIHHRIQAAEPFVGSHQRAYRWRRLAVYRLCRAQGEGAGAHTLLGGQGELVPGDQVLRRAGVHQGVAMEVLWQTR